VTAALYKLLLLFIIINKLCSYANGYRLMLSNDQLALIIMPTGLYVVWSSPGCLQSIVYAKF